MNKMNSAFVFAHVNMTTTRDIWELHLNHPTKKRIKNVHCATNKGSAVSDLETKFSERGVKLYCDQHLEEARFWGFVPQRELLQVL